MTQELADLRKSIVEQRYEDALTLLDELDGMSKKATIGAIESFLVRLVVHLIKNQLEQRLTNSWAASIRGSLIEIQKLNLKENKTSYYVSAEEWQPFLETAIEVGIGDASVEVLGGECSPFQLSEMVDKSEIMQVAQKLLTLTYNHSRKDIPTIINEKLIELPGGEAWKEGRR